MIRILSSLARRAALIGSIAVTIAVAVAVAGCGSNSGREPMTVDSDQYDLPAEAPADDDRNPKDDLFPLD